MYYKRKVVNLLNFTSLKSSAKNAGIGFLVGSVSCLSIFVASASSVEESAGRVFSVGGINVTTYSSVNTGQNATTRQPQARATTRVAASAPLNASDVATWAVLYYDNGTVAMESTGWTYNTAGATSCSSTVTFVNCPTNTYYYAKGRTRIWYGTGYGLYETYETKRLKDFTP